MTIKFGFRDCAVIQRRVREADARGVDITDVATRMVNTLFQKRLADNECGPSVDQAYEQALREVAASWNPGRPPGTRVNDRNEVVPIRAPRPETKPTKRIVPLTIDVEEVEAVEEVEELNPPPPVPLAGEDDPSLEEGFDETDLNDERTWLAELDERAIGLESEDE